MRIRSPAPSEVTSRAMETCRLSFPVQLNPGHCLVKSDESVTLCSWRRTQPMRFGGRGHGDDASKYRTYSIVSVLGII